MANPSVALSAVIKELQLKVIYSPCDPENIPISRSEINRPALPLTGFFDCFEADRLQIVGITENAYLTELSEDERRSRIRTLLSKRPPALIYTHKNPIDDIVIEAAKESTLACSLIFKPYLTAATLWSRIVSVTDE